MSVLLLSKLKITLNAYQPTTYATGFASDDALAAGAGGAAAAPPACARAGARDPRGWRRSCGGWREMDGVMCSALETLADRVSRGPRGARRHRELGWAARRGEG